MTDRHFHTLTLAKKIERTDQACTLEFSVPGDLKDIYAFKAGQYLTFKTSVNGEELRRSYSINSASVGDEPLQVTVKKVKQGRVSNLFVDSLKEGDVLEVMPPLGQFVLPESLPEKTYFYAAGSGITPIFGLVKTLLGSSQSAQVNLQYGNYNREQVIFYAEFEALQAQYAERFSLTHHYTDAKNPKPKQGLFAKLLGKEQAPIANKEFEAGDFTVDKLLAMSKLHPDFAQASHYICGPGQMIPQLEAALLSLGVKQEDIHHEYFAAADAASTASSDQVQASGSDGSAAKLLASRLTVTLDGETETFYLPAGETVLRASIEEGLSVPYACESGVCATCKAKCLKGKVKLRSNAVLSNSELAEGYILTCQAEALTDELHVDYDAV